MSRRLHSVRADSRRFALTVGGNRLLRFSRGYLRLDDDILDIVSDFHRKAEHMDLDLTLGPGLELDYDDDKCPAPPRPLTSRPCSRARRSIVKHVKHYRSHDSNKSWNDEDDICLTLKAN